MRTSTRIAATVVSAGLIAAAMAAPASAAPSSKGTTTVAPSETTLSVLEGVLKPGSLGDAGAMFGITGKPSSGVIKHVGGLAIDGSAGVLEDSYLEIRNFWINTKTGFVSGDVENLGRADLFTLSDVSISQDGSMITATLLFTATASAAVGVNVTGTSAGTATVALK